MKRVVVLLAFIASPAFARQVPVKLADGDTWSLTTWHSSKAIPENPQQRDFTAVYAKRVTWRAGQGAASVVLAPAPSPANSIPFGVEASQTLDIPVVLEVDGSLAPRGIVNLDEVRAAIEGFFARAGATQDLERVKQTMPGVLDATAQALTTRELGYLSKAQGRDLAAGRSASAKREYPSPFGGGVLAVDETLTTESYDAKAKRAVVIWKMAPDMAALRKSFEKLVGESGPTRRDDPTRTTKVTGRCRYVVDLASGLALEAECVFETSAQLTGGPQRIVEEWKITQTPPGAR